jgi:vancomycin resistance protein VanJ
LPALLAVALAALPWGWFAVRDGHPVCDFWAATLPAWAGAGAVAVAVSGEPLAAASWAAMCAVAVGGPWRPRPVPAPDEAASFRLAAVNALYLNSRPRQAAADIAALGADVTGVVELTDAMAEALAGRFSYEHARPVTADHGGIGLYSSLPFTLLDPPPLGDLAASSLRARVETQAGPVVLYLVHVRPPWREDHLTSRQHLGAIDALVDAMAAEELPAVLAGDLNLPDRGQGYRRLAAARTDAMRARAWAAPTYVVWRWRLALLRIDHLFLPRGWGATGAGRARVRGSDHAGLVASVGPAGR